MELIVPFLKLGAGIGMFLFAMYLIEAALKNLSGRGFKLFLQKVTKNSIGAVAGGAIITAILQSSSMVSLMVLAFVGAGVFTMKNALAVILGANLGTLLTGWLVALLGFKTNIEVAAYPAICAGGLLLILLGKHKPVKYLAYFLLGFGLLFIGLSFMKTAMEAQVQAFDFKAYSAMPLIVFLGIGFVITLLVQSSSVTTAITLSALHSGAIEFPAAAAMVLGSETGTTIKIMLSAIGGNASKKRVVLGNILFNIVVTIIAFALLKQILLFITNIIGVKDSIIGLVTFSSIINLSGVVLFVPFLGYYTKFLERFFKGTDASIAAFINHANVAEPETAMDMFRRETRYFIHNAILFNVGQFKIELQSLNFDNTYDAINKKRKFIALTADEKYEFLKQLQGELQSFYVELNSKVEGANSTQLNQLNSAVRSAMYAVKCMNDIDSNIINLSNSSKDVKYQFFIRHKTEFTDLYKRLIVVMQQKEAVSVEALHSMLDLIQTNYSNALSDFYKNAHQHPIEDIDMTTALNFNRELFTSNKAIFMAVKDFLLDEKTAIDFNGLYVYKT
jgi:phosphate:Na+ symporter